MAEKEQFVIRTYDHLWEYIGDLSQEILESSYNEDEIRQMWVSGHVDAEFKKTVSTYPWRFKRWIREDGRQSDLLTALVIKFGGWSPNWSWVPSPDDEFEQLIDPLSPEEQAIVDAFLAKYEIVVSN